ncbi:hypothetical protein DVT68_07280 [Dyella solisilvae]|uniref:Uncharacterized protein n=1 Tax=Dyella solisilvae TaxID=1920168 RepID=A0A370KDI5_9GAMM|nr:hypothetical protein [Dyella solisilvae]RDJ00723.1 hypothetical protein DVT68_07280 [Dyella solisilvae]
MAETMHFPYESFLDLLMQSVDREPAGAGIVASPLLAGVLFTSGEPRGWTPAAASLVPLLKARRATLQAAFDTTLAADELRRYQKFAKPGKPSAHIVQLRQKQASARQATSIARQSLIKAATAFVRDAGIDAPERTPIDEFIIAWIDAHVPRDDP